MYLFWEYPKITGTLQFNFIAPSNLNNKKPRLNHYFAHTKNTFATRSLIILSSATT